jgi:hypothetical protein
MDMIESISKIRASKAETIDVARRDVVKVINDYGTRTDDPYYKEEHTMMVEIYHSTSIEDLIYFKRMAENRLAAIVHQIEYVSYDFPNLNVLDNFIKDQLTAFLSRRIN